MKCDSCVYKRLDGYKEPCRSCKECGYPYLNDVAAEKLNNHYKSERSPFSYPAAREVINLANAVLKEVFPTYSLVGVWRKSLHPEDRHRYFLVAQNPDTIERECYSMWTCFNAKTSSLEHGHYNISNETVSEVMQEHFVFI